MDSSQELCRLPGLVLACRWTHPLDRECSKAIQFETQSSVEVPDHQVYIAKTVLTKEIFELQETGDKANTHSGLVWEQFFAKSWLWVKWFSKGRKLNEFCVPFSSIIFLIYHLNPYCYSPFLMTSVEREQFRIGWIIPKKARPMQNLVRGLARASCLLCFYLCMVHKGTLLIPI